MAVITRIEAAALYLHALRVARWRQLRARATRPLRRRRFPGGAPPQTPARLAGAEALWRSDAFAAPSPPEPGTRLASFHAQYGDDVLTAARDGDEATARRLIAAWIAGNPPRNDDAWHPYPLATRVGNWLAAATLLPGLVDEAFADSVWRQLLRLRRNVEDDILGNHVIRNARALVLGGAAFQAPELMGRGLALLRRELPEQVLADGGHYERSPSYHLVVLRDLLEVQAVAPQAWLEEPIERMRRFAAALQRPDGAPALFNDGTVDAPRLELPAPPEGVAVFEQSGFVVAREGPLWLVFRCGAAGPPFLPPHAHADALSFQLWWRGRPAVVDAGSSTYEPGPQRDWERSTAAHSTVRVDRQDQFRVWGAFRSGPLARVRIVGPLEASVALPGGVEHVRRVEWDAAAGVVVVHDRLLGSGMHEVERRILWAPGEPQAELDADGAAVEVEAAACSDGPGRRVETTASVLRARLEFPAELRFRLTLTG